MGGFAECFSDLQDPRTGNATRHLLLEVLMIALCAMLCGAEGSVDMEAFGKAKERFLKRFLTLSHGIPSHDTFSRIFRFLDPEQFGQFFQAFVPFRRGPSRGDRGRSLSFRGLGKYPARINATP